MLATLQPSCQILVGSCCQTPLSKKIQNWKIFLKVMLLEQITKWLWFMQVKILTISCMLYKNLTSESLNLHRLTEVLTTGMKWVNLFINRINLSQTVLHTHDSWSWKAFWAFDKACDFISAASESVQEKFQAKCKSKSNIMYMFVCTTFCSESELYLTICISILHVNQHSTLDCFHILLGRGFFQFFQNLLCAFIRLWTWKSIQ